MQEDEIEIAMIKLIYQNMRELLDIRSSAIALLFIVDYFLLPFE